MGRSVSRSFIHPPQKRIPENVTENLWSRQIAEGASSTLPPARCQPRKGTQRLRAWHEAVWTPLQPEARTMQSEIRLALTLTLSPRRGNQQGQCWESHATVKILQRWKTFFPSRGRGQR